MYKPLSLVDTYNVMHMNLMCVAEGPRGYVTQEGEFYSLWLKTKHGRYHHSRSYCPESELALLRLLVRGDRP